MTIRLITALLFLLASQSLARAQADMPPTNSLPNPYATIEGWAKLPEGRAWGSTSSVYPDRDGVSMWVGERCGTNSCATSDLNSILKFDSTGRVVRSFGGGMLVSPHGIYVDSEGNIWVTDCACTGGGGGSRGRAAAGRGAADDSAGRGRATGGAGGAGGTGAAGGTSGVAGVTPPPPPPPKGHQIFKFSPEGTLLLTLGKAGGANAPEYFFQPNGLAVAANGNVFVVEGHGQGGDRVLKFSKDGSLIKTWGKRGSGPGEFNQPHAIAIDSRGRIFVGDRSNNRIQIFDQDGVFEAEWYQFGRPSGIFIDSEDNIYVSDAESGTISPEHGAWLRGIRIGKATDGSLSGFIPDPNTTATGTSGAEGVAVDARGVIYGAEVGAKVIRKYVKR